MSRARLAVVGTGHLGRIHARLLSQRPDAELVAVVDPDPRVREELAEELAVMPLCHHDELPQDLVGVVLACPTRYHGEVGTSLLRRRLHLFVEKPIAATLDEADELLETAAAYDRVLQVGHVERFNPAWTAAAPHLDAPRFIDAVRTSGYAGRSTDIGAVLDLMIHDVDLVLAAVDAPLVDVEAVGQSVVGKHEDLALARLRFADGCLAMLKASRISPRAERTWQALTSDGSVELNLASGTGQLICGTPVLSALRQRGGAHTHDEHQLLHEKLYPDFLQERSLQIVPCNAIQCEHTEFLTAIRDRIPVTVPGKAGRAALEVAERIIRSIAVTHRAQRVAAARAAAGRPATRKAG